MSESFLFFFSSFFLLRLDKKEIRSALRGLVYKKLTSVCVDSSVFRAALFEALACDTQCTDTPRRPSVAPLAYRRRTSLEGRGKKATK